MTVWPLLTAVNDASALATVILQALSAIVVKETDGVLLVPVAPLFASGTD